MNESDLIVPLTPEVAMQSHYKNVPGKVIECWNKCIQENLQVRGKKVSSRFLLEELSDKIKQEMECSHDEAQKKGWFDLEDVFRKQGWKVSYDQPGYNESYKAHYEFNNG